jgi:hypothetical protein
LGSEYVGVASVLCLVAWALVDGVVNLIVCHEWSGSAVDYWNNRELFLWS